MFDLTNIILTAIALVLMIVSAVVIPYVKTKVSAEQLATIQTWVYIAVNAAEQLFEGSNRGEEKKEYVLDFLESKGFTIDLDSIDAMIESAVLELNQSLTP